MTLLSSLTVIGALLFSLPAGWRPPAAEEVNQEWRNKGQGRFLMAVGDFDGDQKKDRAQIVVSSDGRAFAVAVSLSSTPAHLILEKGDIESLSTMGIAPVQPGSYKTACGKGYGDWACANGEPKVLELKTAAIDLFANGSADVILYWDPKSKQFKRVQMSD